MEQKLIYCGWETEILEHKALSGHMIAPKQGVEVVDYRTTGHSIQKALALTAKHI